MAASLLLTLGLVASAGTQGAPARPTTGGDVVAQDPGCTVQAVGIGMLRSASAGSIVCQQRANGQLAVVEFVAGTDEPPRCGQCLRVSGSGTTVDVVIGAVRRAAADFDPGDLLATADTLQRLQLPAGTPISWVSVPCPVTGGLVLDLTRETSGRLRLVVSGSRTSIAKVSLRGTQGKAALILTPAGAFEASSPGPAPWRLVLEDIHGRVVELTLDRPGQSQATTVQFPECAQLFSDGFEGGDLSSWGRRTGP